MGGKKKIQISILGLAKEHGRRLDLPKKRRNPSNLTHQFRDWLPYQQQEDEINQSMRARMGDGIRRGARWPRALGEGGDGRRGRGGVQ